VLNKIKDTERKANDEAVNMMKNLMEQNKMTDVSDCVNPKLLNFENKNYVTNVCKLYYGENRRSFCEDKKNFCDQCCGEHIGISHKDKLFECKENCTKLINGIEIKQNFIKSEINQLRSNKKKK
jgi:hypothetical protein